MISLMASMSLLAAMAPESPALSDRELLERARTPFLEGANMAKMSPQTRAKFRASATAFESLRQRGFRSPELFLDQGNASALAGDLPSAIVAYERGLQLSPADRRLRANLTWGQEQVAALERGGLCRPTFLVPPLWPASRLGAGLGFLIYVSGWLSLGFWWTTRRTWLVAAALFFLALGALAATTFALLSWRFHQDQEWPLVVVAKDHVALRTGNGYSYPPRYSTELRAGCEARRLFTRGNWIQIELPAGAVGWIPLADALPVDSQ